MKLNKLVEVQQRDPVILVVDDNPENLRLLMEVLEGQRYQTKLARSGELALASAVEEVPDLVLLDINMPEMDGFEVCDRLKAEEATRNVPIIFISALNQTDDKVAALNRGGVDYITKPFQVEEVLARVESHLELQALRRKLERNNASLQTRNESLATFARALAHDIRNPLSGVSSTADFWMSCNGDGIDTEVSMGNIKDSADRIEGIVDGLLLLTRSEMEGFDLEPLNMLHLVKRSEQALNSMIREYDAKIHMPDEWPQVVGCPPWVEQVWVNYISNALKYSGRPPVIELGGDWIDEETARFWVRDNGEGMKEEACKKLFKEFVRLHSGKAKGIGLGLSIVKRIVARMNGEVGVTSELGRGSTFYFTLRKSPPDV